MFIDIGCCDNDALDAMEDTSAPFIKAGLEKDPFEPGWPMSTETRFPWVVW